MEFDAQSIGDALRASGINQVLYQIGDRWSHTVLMALFTGSRRFQVIQQRHGIPKQTLSDCLKNLVEIGLVERRLYQTEPPRHEYRLTPTGLALYPMALANWSWDRKWGKSDEIPARLHHRNCGHNFRPLFVCAACGERAGPRDVAFGVHPGAAPRDTEPPRRTPRWQGRLADAGVENGPIPVYAWLADRWSMLIVGAILLGCHRFDQLLAVLGIGTNILATRLDLLCRAEVLTKHKDLLDGRRFVYGLTGAGRDLFYNIVTLEQWAEQTEIMHNRNTLSLLHKPCGNPLVLKVVCSHCNDELQPRDVSFDADSMATAPAQAEPRSEPGPRRSKARAARRPVRRGARGFR